MINQGWCSSCWPMNTVIVIWGGMWDFCSCATVSLIKAHVDESSGARGLNFNSSLHLHPYFVYASSEGSGETVDAHVAGPGLAYNISHVMILKFDGGWSVNPDTAIHFYNDYSLPIMLNTNIIYCLDRLTKFKLQDGNFYYICRSMVFAWCPWWWGPINLARREQFSIKSSEEVSLYWHNDLTKPQFLKVENHPVRYSSIN